MNYIVIFEMRIDILKYIKILQLKGIIYELRNAPRILSKSCVLAVFLKYGGDSQDIITPEVYKLYRIEPGKYSLVYQNG